MKTLNSMFLLCCWFVLSFSFATDSKESLEEIKANELQQIIQEKEAVLEAQNAEPAKVLVQERVLIPINNLDAEKKAAAEEAAARKAAALEEKLNQWNEIEAQVEEAVVNPPKFDPNSLPHVEVINNNIDTDVELDNSIDQEKIDYYNSLNQKPNPDQEKIDYYNSLKPGVEMNTVIFEDITLVRGTYSLTVGGGSYDSEISWEIAGTSNAGAAGSHSVDLDDGTYTFIGYDSYGDGWNGGSASMDDADGNSVFSGFTFASGTSESVDFTVPGEASGCDSNALTLVVGGGSYDSEISWDLSDGSSGGAGSFELCLADGDYTFNGADSYGDGWNGGSATFSDADGNVIASYAVEGYSGSWTLTIGGAPPVGGCTDDTADNFNPDATYDDGSCLYNGCPAGQIADCADGHCGPAGYLGDGWCDGVAADWGIDLSCYDCDAGDCASDCNGDCEGSAVIDCNGDCDGGAVVDGCGECGGDGSSCAGSDYTLTVGGGSYDSEISWDLSDGSSGGAGTFVITLEDGDYTFNGYDSYGDGWNGGSATISSADGLLYTFIVEDSSGSWDFSLPGEVDTNVYGCMLEGAAEYNSDATVDDGSCTPFPGGPGEYWGCAAGSVVGCGSYFCFDPAQIGDGYCDVYYGGPYGLDCAENGNDGCDCGTQGDDPDAPCYE